MYPMPTLKRRDAMRRAAPGGCQVVRERDFKLVGHLTLDLSTEGMLVMADPGVLTGESMIVSFLAPRTRVWVDAEATVVRVVHGRRPGDLGVALGLAFHYLEPKARAVLGASLLPLPMRAPKGFNRRLPSFC